MKYHHSIYGVDKVTPEQFTQQLRLIEIVNEMQEKHNSFVNLGSEDVYNLMLYINKHNLDNKETRQLIEDLNYA